jgi:hypothetical protein
MSATTVTPRTSQCLCRLCGQVFRSERPFKRHRVGEYEPNTRRCLTAAELQTRGYVQNARGVWQFALRKFGTRRAPSVTPRQAPAGYVAMTMHAISRPRARA